MVYTNQNANPTTVSLMLYVGVFYSFFCDKYLFSHIFSGLELAGVMVCLVCSVVAALYKWNAQNEEKKGKVDDGFTKLEEKK